MLEGYMKFRAFYLATALCALLVSGVLADDTDKSVTDSVTATQTDTVQKIATDTSVHADKVIAYYFHGYRRCASCLKIEAYTKEAIDSFFAEPLTDGRLEWQVVNTDDEENQHFLKDYQLYTKSVVLVEMNKDKQVRWKNLDRVWKLLGDKKEFMDYIHTELNAFLTGE
jgi:hypothetical protein